MPSRLRSLRLRIPVDIDRLDAGRGDSARGPERAVILGNYPDRVHVVREAWEPQGIEVSQVGGAQQRFDIAPALEGADIVVAKSRAALDAMACGRAVYVYDTFGGDGWVTPEAYAALEADHFAGQATDRVIGPAELRRDLADYDPDMGDGQPRPRRPAPQRPRPRHRAPGRARRASAGTPAGAAARARSADGAAVVLGAIRP